MIQLNGQQFWLYAAVDPETNELLHVRLFPTRTIVLTKQFLQELQEKHDIADAVFLVDGAPWLQTVLFKETPISACHPWKSEYCRTCFQRGKSTNRTVYESFPTPLSRIGLWFQTFAFAWNQLI